MNDEVDITTVKIPTDTKHTVITDHKTGHKNKELLPKDGETAPVDEKSLAPDQGQDKNSQLEPKNYVPDGEYPVESGVKEAENPDKNYDKTPIEGTGGPEFDLGKDYKKVAIKDKDLKNKNTGFGFDDEYQGNNDGGLGGVGNPTKVDNKYPGIGDGVDKKPGHRVGGPVDEGQYPNDEIPIDGKPVKKHPNIGFDEKPIKDKYPGADGDKYPGVGVGDGDKYPGIGGGDKYPGAGDKYPSIGAGDKYPGIGGGDKYPGAGDSDKGRPGIPSGGADYEDFGGGGIGGDKGVVDPGAGGHGGHGTKYDPALIKIGNHIMDHLLVLMKRDYRRDFEKVALSEVGPIKHGRWGSVILHDGWVTGLTNIERAGDVLMMDEFAGRKLIVSDLVVRDIYADYKVNAKLFHRISIKNRELKLSLRKAVLNVRLEVDKNQQKLVVKDVLLKSKEGFGVKSGRLVWPFNKLTDSIVKSQELVVMAIIQKEVNRYMGRVVDNIKFDEVFSKLFLK
ncbi:unnamed protein product [Oppiella nova]|uniref:Uncharacterized protein n=1 Tax=Oppiella nova TaxID=334625 RepID=A0A7R9LMZ6_9ACAR|nr:unnamed protein product [Oppiella nova]CAG2165256.1 unnamed protein product [Oppiella nova]